MSMRNTLCVTAGDRAACVISAIFYFFKYMAVHLRLCIRTHTWKKHLESYIYPIALLAVTSRGGFMCDFLFTLCMLFVLLFTFTTEPGNKFFFIFQSRKKKLVLL